MQSMTIVIENISKTDDTSCTLLILCILTFICFISIISKTLIHMPQAKNKKTTQHIMQAESSLSSGKANPCNWNKSLIEVIEVVRKT